MNEVISELKIENMIYEIRGVQVMLDSDLAKLYQVETKRINEVIKRNIEYHPFVLTGQGIMMLSGLLKSDIVVKVNVYIVRAFFK